jgi:hypothetical protein
MGRHYPSQGQWAAYKSEQRFWRAGCLKTLPSSPSLWVSFFPTRLLCVDHISSLLWSAQDTELYRPTGLAHKDLYWPGLLEMSECLKKEHSDALRDVEGDWAILEPVCEAIEIRGLIKSIGDKIYFRKRKALFKWLRVIPCSVQSQNVYSPTNALVANATHINNISLTETNELTCRLVPDNGLEI